MKVLVIGGGGREHALVWKLAQDSCKPEIFCAPGNAGTAVLATNVPISAEDVPALVAWCKVNRPDLVVVGPEVALCAGIVDDLEKEGIRAFGPNKVAAQLEGSKIFSKDVMLAAGIPTAEAYYASDVDCAMENVHKLGLPIVIKAEGLAAGKGVTVCKTMEDAKKAIEESIVGHTFGSAGANILVEEYLEGEEVSVLGLVDGEHVVLLSSAQDHKRAFDGDLGPNTGGMGAYSPAPVFTADMAKYVEIVVFGRLMKELRKRGIIYKGVLYAGLMIAKSGIKVLEFNCRFGDPETQVILPRLVTDLIPALEACIDGTLTPNLVKFSPKSCVCVALVAGGYPGHYEKGKAIVGVEAAEYYHDVLVFHAGTKKMSDGTLLSWGGRVLGVTALRHNVSEAISSAYVAMKRIHFDDMRFRTDIAARALVKAKRYY